MACLGRTVGGLRAPQLKVATSLKSPASARGLTLYCRFAADKKATPSGAVNSKGPCASEGPFFVFSFSLPREAPEAPWGHCAKA